MNIIKISIGRYNMKSFSGSIYVIERVARILKKLLCISILVYMGDSCHTKWTAKFI